MSWWYGVWLNWNSVFSIPLGVCLLFRGLYIIIKFAVDS
jgi:hypothetical protein